MTNLSERFGAWREVTSLSKPPEPVSRVTDRVADHHRQQLERAGRLTLANLRAHDHFCRDIEAYVIAGSSERSEEHQQRVTDYAGYLLRLYENTGSRALEQVHFKVLQDKFEEVQVIRSVREAPRRELPPQRSRLHRFLIG
jgi:hypothetical protein